MSAQVEGQGAGAMAQFSQSGTTANSSKSGHGSEPLSDALELAAAEVEKGTTKRPGQRVKVPAGAGHFLTDVHRSLCVALARSKSVQEPAEGPILIKAPPGIKPSIGYQYQVLQPVAEEASKIPGQLGKSMGSAENVGGSWDINSPQVSSTVGMAAIKGRKQSATSEVPGALERVHNPMHLASTVDFSPTHFLEPRSDGLLDAWQGHSQGGPSQRPLDLEEAIPDRALVPTSPTPIDRNTPPSSSPISHDPLLQRSSAINVHIPSPARKRSDTFYTWDADKAWLAAESLVPLADNFCAPGFVSAQVVGGITYKVHSPESRHIGMTKLSAGRRLFNEHLSAVREPPGPFPYAPQHGLHSPPNSPFEQHHPPLINALFRTQAGPQMVTQAHAQTHLVHIAFDSIFTALDMHIVRIAKPAC
ncbi:hypothetical protein L208DRAFT_1393186 [Tricholoma matsutake]|nr:hypothetical protein L208DRAFT_1393186 [Tricholoma matsutake 945]